MNLSTAEMKLSDWLNNLSTARADLVRHHNTMQSIHIYELLGLYLLAFDRLLFEIARSAILGDNFELGIIFEVTHRGANPLAVRHHGDAAMPRRGKAGFGVEQTHRHLVLAGRLMNGETQVIRKGGLDCSRKSLLEDNLISILTWYLISCV